MKEKAKNTQHGALDGALDELAKVLHLRLNLNERAVASGDLSGYVDTFEQSNQLIALLWMQINTVITPEPIGRLLRERDHTRVVEWEAIAKQYRLNGFMSAVIGLPDVFRDDTDNVMPD